MSSSESSSRSSSPGSPWLVPQLGPVDTPSANGAASLAAISERKLLRELTENLQEEDRKSAFAMGGFIPIVDPDFDGSQSPSEERTASNIGSVCSDTEPSTSGRVILRWDTKDSADRSVNRIAFPVAPGEETQLAKLISDCEPAKFGRGNEDILDETYRKAGKLDETSFSSNFNPYSLGIVDSIASILLPSISGEKVARKVRAELYKLNVYSGPSGKFKPHVDTPRSASQFGSLVVCFPCSHSGGQLVVRHNDDDAVFDWSTDQAADSIAWASFYSDCEHEVLEVTKGHRVTLTYNLYVVSTEIPQGVSALDPQTLPLYSKLRNFLDQPGFMTKGGSLGVYCAHEYAHTSAAMISRLPWGLKGVDMVAYQAFIAAGLKVELRPIISRRRQYDEVDRLARQFGLKWDQKKWGLLTYWIEDYDRELQNALNGANDATEEEITHRDTTIAEYRKMDPGEGAVFVGDRFRGLSVTGMGDGISSLDVWRALLKKVEYFKIEWLNEQRHRQPSLVHVTYGNEAGINTVYSSAALIIQVPPFTERKDRS